MKKNRLRAFRVALFVVAVALVAYCLPRSGENELQYEVNRPWAYTLLTAPFDIPIHIDSITAREIRDSINQEFEPVMRRDIVGEKEMIEQIAQRVQQSLALTAAQKNSVISGFKTIYDAGIVPRDVYEKIKEGELPSVKFLHDNVAMSMPTSEFMSPRAAYMHLDSLFHDVHIQQALSQAGVAGLIKANIIPDSVATQKLLGELYQRAMAPIGVVQQGERIVDKGDIVTLRLATVLDTYQEMLRERNQGQGTGHHYPLAGQVLYIVIVLGALYSYLYFFRKDYFENARIMTFMMIMIVGFALFAFGMNATFRLGIYLVPFAILPLLIHIFLDSRTAMFCNMVSVLLTAVVVSFPLEFIFMQFMAGMVAVASIHELTRRGQLLKAAVLVFVVYSLSFIAIEVMQTGTIEKIILKMLACFGINAVFISFGYILMFLVERVFGFTSRVTLVELSDINNPLLRELSEECPGTFQHSMAVSNLSSAAAARIGANAQLVRTGALYHDVGKIANPAFYTENQHGVNPHDTLDPVQSARIVTGHVTEGLAMADKAKLPQSIKNFITQHHGKGKARYFYNTYCNSHPGEEVDVAAFEYPGPNPNSKETSIVMMADSVEAASRSLTDHSPQAIKNLVDNIIDTQIREGLHNNSDLSFRDVQKIKDVFVQRLRTMFHSRISYPELKTKD